MRVLDVLNRVPDFFRASIAKYRAIKLASMVSVRASYCQSINRTTGHPSSWSSSVEEKLIVPACLLEGVLIVALFG